jgi:hypothetical protein
MVSTKNYMRLEVVPLQFGGDSGSLVFDKK